MTTATTTSDPPSNPRGIPSFPFLPSVTDYVKTSSEVESTLQRFQEMISKYQFMSQNVERRAAGLREKLPEMRKSLDTVKFLRLQQESASSVDEEGLDDEKADAGLIETTYALQDTLYAHATVDAKELDSVYLWLGANVMVAYPLEEAESMLTEKLQKAKESLKAADEDLEFIRVQTTTLEVATARVHNWDVGEKRKRKEAGGEKEKDKDED